MNRHIVSKLVFAGCIGFAVLNAGCGSPGQAPPAKPTDSTSFVQSKLNDPNVPENVKTQIRASMEKSSPKP